MPRFPLGIMSTCVVPWDEQGEMLEDLFRHQVRESVRGTKNLYVFGTACEGYAVSERQFDRVTTVFSDEMRHKADQILVVSRFKFTRDETLQANVTAK